MVGKPKKISSSDKLQLEFADRGTIKIDCSGAYIGNDNLLRGQHSSTASSSSSTPQSSDQSSDSDGDATSDSKNQNKQLDLIYENYIQPATSIEERVAEKVPAANGEINCPKNINLPKHNSEVIHISVDIGGTLTKLVYFTKSRRHNGNGGGKLHFRDFQTENFSSEVLDFMIKLIQMSTHKHEQPPITYILATGGGAHKFYRLMKDTFRKRSLPMKIIAKDEMECLIKGLNWLITKIPNEIFTYDLNTDDIKFTSSPFTGDDDIYPYLLVNIGSGVSMIKVTGPGPHGFERVGGSSLGGGTLWGLLSLLTDAKDYNEMLEMAQRGNNENIDLLVGDIYGAGYNKIGLKSTHIASSFAKVFKKLRFNQDKKMSPAEKLSRFKPEDIARSLLYLVSNNIGQIAYLQALRYNLKRIYFGGSYISGHMQTIHTLTYAFNFWSNGDMQAYFLRHEGYLGSVGAFIMGPSSDGIVNYDL